MTSEHVLMIDTHQAIPFTVADGGAIPKGSLLTMSDPMTAALTTTKEAIIAGVAKTEKIALDGKTKLAVYRGGVFKATASGSITVGDALISSTGGTNLLETAGVNGEDIVGEALETCTTGETFLYQLNPFSMNLA